MIGKGGEAAAQPVQTDFRQAVTGGASPEYWNREATYNEATEKYRDNRARLLHGLSAEDRALYDEYRSTEREMGAMLDGSMLYDESRMDELEKRSDELYKELYGKEWFGKLNRYDRILGDASEAVKEFYLNTAGEIEARDTAARRRMTAEERKKTPPDLGDADTVFADRNDVSAYVDVDADGNPVTVIKTAKALFDGAPKSAYANIAKKLIMSEYAGKTLPLGENNLARITKASGGEYGYPSNTLPTNSKEFNAKMRASAELHNLLENSTYDHWAADKKNHAEATLGFDYYKTVFIVDGKVFEGLINIANSENGRVFYDITNIKEAPDYTRKYAAPLARSSSTFGNLSTANIRAEEGNSQEKSSGRASVEVESRAWNNEIAADAPDDAEGNAEADKRREWFRKMAQQDRQEAARLMRKDETLARANREYGRPAPDKGAGQVYRAERDHGPDAGDSKRYVVVEKQPVDTRTLRTPDLLTSFREPRRIPAVRNGTLSIPFPTAPPPT